MLCAPRARGAARQGWSGTGYFVEDKESLGANPLKSAEQKKLLSAVEKSGLLSRAEKAGLTLTRVRHHVRLWLAPDTSSELMSGKLDGADADGGSPPRPALARSGQPFRAHVRYMRPGLEAGPALAARCYIVKS